MTYDEINQSLAETLEKRSETSTTVILHQNDLVFIKYNASLKQLPFLCNVKKNLKPSSKSKNKMILDTLKTAPVSNWYLVIANKSNIKNTKIVIVRRTKKEKLKIVDFLNYKSSLKNEDSALLDCFLAGFTVLIRCINKKTKKELIKRKVKNES